MNTHPDELLQAFRLTNPGQFHRELMLLKRNADGGLEGARVFLENLADVLAASKREPSPHTQK